MTTTLRPLEPERRAEDGQRSRRYAVCVNSRQAGEILVGAHDQTGAVVGRLSGLRIEEEDRRCGRGTVAALAAEEVLRQWGCERVEAVVPGGSDAGLRLTEALGYTEQNRQLAKTLPAAPPPLPPGCVPRVMTAEDFPAWHERESDGYIRTWIRTGVPEAEARRRAEAGYRRYLPDREKSADTALRVLSFGGEDVGWLWLALRSAFGSGGPGVLSVEVDEGHRGRGHGRSLMLLAEAECIADGAKELGLNVFVSNTPAMRLYESLGYRVVNHYFTKPLL